MDAKIIFPIQTYQWVTNLVLVKKKNGEICLCIDLRNLNQASQKGGYPILPLEKIR